MRERTTGNVKDVKVVCTSCDSLSTAPALYKEIIESREM
jgi:hypothetical protein